MGRLLEVRLCDLELEIQGTAMERRTAQVRGELERRGIRFQPHFWVSDDWFTPDGGTGTAVPFYLLHPRLARLERSMTGEVDGGTYPWCMKILRHEVGHALQHAYLLQRKRRWQQLFGLSSRPYPRYYRPNPYSKRHVQHLEYWYAQSHPDEDFAETFAVWLGAKARWRKLYRGWPALKKLEYVDELMAEITGQRPVVRTRLRVDPISRLRETLGEYYESKTAWVEDTWPDIYDRDLRRLFSDSPRHRQREAASAFIRRMRPEVVQLVSRWVGEHRYHLEHVFKEIVGRCRDLKLHVAGAERNLKRDFAILLTKYTVDALYRSRGWMSL